MDALSLNNPVFSGFAFYTAILVAKMVLLSCLTAKTRIGKKVFANQEDVDTFGKAENPELKVVTTDPDVERIRRAHRNDLENITAFLFIGLIYVLCGPSVQVALWHFRLFALARILHTFFYVIRPAQPHRFYAFLGGLFVTLSLIVQVILRAL